MPISGAPVGACSFRLYTHFPVLPLTPPRPLSQPAPYALHYPLEENADGVSLARTISKDSLASSVLSITPKHKLSSGPQLRQHRLSGQSLLSHMRIEDEEEEVEEEELVAVIHPSAFSRHRMGSDMEQDELDAPTSASAPRVPNARSPHLDVGPFSPELPTDSYYLEPLMPAIAKPAKEKSISLNKEEESGESRSRASRRISVPSASQRKAALRPPTEGASASQPQGFFLHLSGDADGHSHFSSALEGGHDSDSDVADFEDDDDDDDLVELTQELARRGKSSEEMRDFAEAEGESFKLREDSKVTEREDKEDGSGRSSPCLSTASWASSCSASGSASVKMTSFAERKLLKLGLRDGFSSTSSSQKTTPDGSESSTGPPWQLRGEGSAGRLVKEPGSVMEKTLGGSPVVPSELLQLHMQLEEQRRAIEFQKKKMETLSARQRLKLGKAAFLNILKKGEGRSDTLPLPLRHSPSSEQAPADKLKVHACKDDSFLEALKSQARAGQGERRQADGDNRTKRLPQDSESDMNECSRSIDLLSEAISSIQQQMMQLSLQQNLLMKQSAASPPDRVEPSAVTQTPPTSDARSFAVHFVDLGDGGPAPARRPPKLSSGQRSATSERKPPSNKAAGQCTTSPKESASGAQELGVQVESSKLERNAPRNTTFRVHEGSKPHSVSEGSDSQEPSGCWTPSQTAQDEEKKGTGGEDSARVKGHLIEVDLSELKDPVEVESTDASDCTGEGEQKNVLGFFFKVSVSSTRRYASITWSTVIADRGTEKNFTAPEPLSEKVVSAARPSVFRCR